VRRKAIALGDGESESGKDRRKEAIVKETPRRTILIRAGGAKGTGSGLSNHLERENSTSFGQSAHFSCLGI